MHRVIVESPYAGLKITKVRDLLEVDHPDMEWFQEFLFDILEAKASRDEVPFRVPVEDLPGLVKFYEDEWPPQGRHDQDFCEHVYEISLENNVEYAQKCLYDALTRGEAPFASHLLYTQPNVLDDDIPEERDWGILAGFAWHEVADYSVSYVDRGISTGMAYGVLNSSAAGMKVVFRSLEKDWSEELDLSNFAVDLSDPDAINKLKSKLSELVDQFHAKHIPTGSYLTDDEFSQLLDDQRPDHLKEGDLVMGEDGPVYVKRNNS